jgi:hypothetical protein
MTALRAATPGACRVPFRRTAWLVWRQQRAVVATTIVAGTIIGVLLIIDILAMTHANALGVRACLTGNARPEPNCDYPIGLMAQATSSLPDLKMALLVFPALIGAFAGAPLVAREYEIGTIHYTWTQGLPPRRWLMLTMALTVASISAVTIADGILFNIASGLASLGFRYTVTGATFPAQAPALPAWSVFAYTLGVGSGVVIRRTLPSMAATLCGYGAVYYLTKEFFRPHYLGVAFWEGNTPHLSYFWLYQAIEAGWLLLAALTIALAVTYSGRMVSAVIWRRNERAVNIAATGGRRPRFTQDTAAS